jgi:Uma2 family endonuclease
MPTGTLISVEEYLARSYHPDCDYVDGQVEERNLGERDHSNLQMIVSAYLFARRKQWGIQVYPEQRVQVKPNRLRVPDICVVLGATQEQIFTKPPFLCIEIVSPEDRISRVKERIDDYLAMGVPYAWLLDPGSRSAYVCTTAEGLREIKSGILKTENPILEVPLNELFDE